MKHYLGICLILVTVAAIAFFALRSCTTVVDHTIGSIRNAFSQVLSLQPQITINQRVILTQTAPIAELAVVTKDELVTLGFTGHLEVLSMQVPLTEKTLMAEATYRIKAGFDLRQPFTVAIDPTSHELRATMPHAILLSVEQTGKLVLHGDDALLNRITDAEREQIVNNLNTAARAGAENSTLKADAEQQVAQRLKEILTHNGQPMQIEWRESPVQKTIPRL